MAHKFKGVVQVEGALALPNLTASRAMVLDGSGNAVDSAVTSTELGYMSGVTSAVQTQLGDKAASADLASTANGDGASLIGIEDSAAIFTAANVEAALAEVKALADSNASSLSGHLDGGSSKHDASEIDVEAADGKNHSAGSAEAVIGELDDAIGALAASPTNYTPTDASIVADHLSAIDSQLASAAGTDFADDEFRVSDNTDSSKKIALEASAIATSTVRTISMPDADVDLADVALNNAKRHDALTLNSGDATQQSANLSGQELELVQATDSTDGVMSAEDKAKLDGVESGATADQTGAEIKSLYEGEADTNAFTDAEKTKLSGIEASAKDDQSAAEVPFTPDGDIAASDVQAAIEEVRDDADTKLADKLALAGGTMSGAIAMGSNKITGLAAPTASDDAARLADVQAASAGQLPKAPVDLVSTSNITLSGEQTLDGVLTSASRVLVAGQTNTDDNGIYVSAAGAWSRATDADGTPASEIAQGNTTLVLSGTANANTVYILNATDAADPAEIGAGTESQEWIIYSRAESVTASTGLTKSGLDIRLADAAENASGIKVLSGAITLEDLGAFDSDDLAEGSSNLYITDARVRDAVLTGFSSGAGTVAATDSVLEAIQKLDGNVSAASHDAVTLNADDATQQTLNLSSQEIQVNLATSSTDGAMSAEDKSKLDGIEANAKDDQSAAEVAFTPNGDIAASDVQAAIQEVRDDADTKLADKADESIEVQTAANTSGLAGGGDLSANRSLSVDISGTTLQSSAAADADLVLIYSDANSALRSISKADLVGSADSSAGDIAETSFSIANSQAAAANVTGLAFANGVVRSFKAHVSIEIDATADLFEVYELMGIQKGASWEMSQVATGDDSEVLFTITSAGQVQYTSGTYAGFSSGAVKFRAETTSV